MRWDREGRERDCRALNREQRREHYEERRDRQIETTRRLGLTEPTQSFLIKQQTTFELIDIKYN